MPQATHLGTEISHNNNSKEQPLYQYICINSSNQADHRERPKTDTTHFIRLPCCSLILSVGHATCTNEERRNTQTHADSIVAYLLVVVLLYVTGGRTIIYYNNQRVGKERFKMGYL